jgi:ribose transport system substrate-binding protein
MVKSMSLPRWGAIGVTILIVAACSSNAATQAPASQAAGASQAAPAPTGVPVAQKNAAAPFTIGYSNAAGVGNGFREEQVCTAKSEAKALGTSKIAQPMTLIHRTTDAAGQLSDLRTLIADHVNAIVFNPNDPNALQPALDEAHAAGIYTVSVDSYVTDPVTWNLYNNQVMYAKLGAEWLFNYLHGTGTVWYTRGLAGNSADSDRDTGFNQALAEFPNIKVINPGGTFTGWDPATATQITNDFLNSGNYDNIQGIWASGMGAQIDDAIKAAGKPLKPIADADIGAFVHQLLTPADYPGLVGAAVTNTASVGGAGVKLAYDLLTGAPPQASTGGPEANTVLLTPQILDNTTDTGKAALQAWLAVPGMDPLWPLSLSIPGWTDYDPTTVPTDCSGAGANPTDAPAS